jgi:hypothetical protein
MKIGETWRLGRFGMLGVDSRRVKRPVFVRCCEQARL